MEGDALPSPSLPWPSLNWIRHPFTAGWTESIFKLIKSNLTRGLGWLLSALHPNALTATPLTDILSGLGKDHLELVSPVLHDVSTNRVERREFRKSSTSFLVRVNDGSPSFVRWEALGALVATQWYCFVWNCCVHIWFVFTASSYTSHTAVVHPVSVSSLLLEHWKLVCKVVLCGELQRVLKTACAYSMHFCLLPVMIESRCYETFFGCLFVCFLVCVKLYSLP